MLAFWQERVGLPFGHALSARRGQTRCGHLEKVVDVVEHPAAQRIGEAIVQHRETREVSREMCSRYLRSCEH